MAFGVIRLCDKIKGKDHYMYIDRWYSSEKTFNHLWACKTQGVGTVMSKRKEMHKQAFSGKLAKRQKNITPMKSTLGYQMGGHPGCFSLNQCP